MKSQSVFFVQSTHKTKTWWTFLSVFVLVFVPFLIVWLLCGEFNLLNNDWMIAQNSSVWHGVVNEDNIQSLIEKYGPYTDVDLATQLPQCIGKSMSIDAYKTFFNPIVLAPLFGLLAFSIAYPMIFNATKISGLDVLPFSTALGFFMITLIISGLIPQWGQNMLVVYWFTRIVIAAFVTFIVFLLANYFTNKFIASRGYAFDIYFGYKTIEKQNASAKQQLQDNVDIYKKQKDQDESFVEIEEGK